MNRRIYGLLSVVAALGLSASCQKDPTASLRGGPASLELQYAYREVIIADSVRVTATVRDEQNNPIALPVTITACNPAVASVSMTNAAPLPQTAFFLKGVSYGTTCVAAAAAGFVDTMQVATFPARIEVIGPDTVLSGTTVQFQFKFFDAAGNEITGLPAPTWASSSATVASVDASGNVSGRAPGQVRVTATGVGSPAGGTSFGRTFVVVPGVFTGTFSPTSGGSGDRITFTRAAGGPAFDNDTQIAFGPGFTIPSWTDQVRVTADAIDAAVPVVPATGAIPFVLTNIGPSQVALAGTYTVNSNNLTDPSDPGNDDPAGGPTITVNGAYFVITHGTCDTGVPTDPGDDCDDFFTITNNLSRPDTIIVNVAWVGAPSAGADIDVLWCLNVCFDFSDMVGNFNGATATNPETTTVIMPAGATWRLWINLFDPHGTTHALARVRVTGKG